MNLATNRPHLTLQDLVAGLDRFGSAYHAIDVFADDVEELRAGAPIRGLQSLGVDGRRFVYSLPDGRSYELLVFPAEGVVRLARPSADAGTYAGEGAALGAVAGTAIGAASTRKGEGAAVGLLLGLLVGVAIGVSSSKEPAPRRVFTLSFDPATREWQAYDGGLVPWMKEQLLPRSAAG